ncbi:GTPase-associated system all-helical protein GASH [Pseudomonas lini]
MTTFTFADRYAEAGLSPGPQVISARQEPVKRIVEEITDAQILDLAGAYYGNSGVKLNWMRDEFIKEDASFSLVNNEREAQVLAALILGELVGAENSIAILAVIVGNVMGLRSPTLSLWLLSDATEAHGRLAVKERKPGVVTTKVTPKTNPKLAEEIAAVTPNDWATLLEMLAKMRSEAHESAKTTAVQSTNALSALDRHVKLVREESQMLWWLFGGHSRSLERGFDTFNSLQAAIVGAVDLGDLTTKSELGPVAAQAMLERVIALSKKPKGAQSHNLAAAVDGIAAEDIGRLTIFSDALPPRLAPVMAAIGLAKTMGAGAWYVPFKSKAGLDASISVEPILLAEQLYREYLLGRLL